MKKRETLLFVEEREMFAEGKKMDSYREWHQDIKMERDKGMLWWITIYVNQSDVQVSRLSWRNSESESPESRRHNNVPAGKLTPRCADVWAMTWASKHTTEEKARIVICWIY